MAAEKSEDLLINPIENLYSDPVSASTRKTGWILTLAASATLGVLVLKLHPSQVFGFSNINQSGENGTPALAVTIVFGLIIPYLLKMLAEIFRKKEADNQLAEQISEREKAWSIKEANAVSAKAYKGLDDGSPVLPEREDAELYDSVRSVHNKMTGIQSLAMKRIINVKWPKILKEFRFWTTLFAPLLFAAMALWIGRSKFLEVVGLFLLSL